MPILKYFDQHPIHNSFNEDFGDLEFSFHGKSGYGDLEDSQNDTSGAIWISNGDATGVLFDRVPLREDCTQNIITDDWIAVMTSKDGVASCSCYKWSVSHFKYNEREDILNFGVCQPYFGQYEEEAGDECSVRYNSEAGVMENVEIMCFSECRDKHLECIKELMEACSVDRELLRIRAGFN